MSIRSSATSSGSGSTGPSNAMRRTISTSSNDWAIVLIKKGLAYVDDQTQEQIRENRGTVSVPGTPSPWRDRSVEENLDLFVRMKNGEFPDGAKVLRAKIDMAHPNMLFRDPIMYRIIHAEHHRTGNKWCIYRCTTMPRPERLDRADHPLDLHARIRRAPSSLRLVHPALEIYLRTSTNSPG